MRRFLHQVSRRVDRVCRVGSVAFFSAMLILVLFQVVARYVFKSVPIWTEEAARYCMIWGGLLGATVAFRDDSDPRLIQPPKTGPIWKILGARYAQGAAVAIFLGPVLYHGRGYILRTMARTSDALGISMIWVTAALPICLAIIFLHLLARLAGRQEAGEAGPVHLMK